LSSLVKLCCGALASAIVLGTAVARGDELICHPLSSDLAQVRYDVRPVSNQNFVKVTVPRRVGNFQFQRMSLLAGPRSPGRKVLELFISDMSMNPGRRFLPDLDEADSVDPVDPNYWRHLNTPSLETSFMAADFHNSSIELTAYYNSEYPGCATSMEILVFPRPPSPSPGPPH